MMTERLAQQGKLAKGANYETGKDHGRLCLYKEKIIIGTCQARPTEQARTSLP